MSGAVAKHWLTPAGLLTLSFVPMVAGVARMIQLGAGTPLSGEDARFSGSPYPVLAHIIAAIAFSLIGAFQFTPHARARRPHWHRAAGRALIPCGLVTALSGLWMNQFYPRIGTDSVVLYAVRLGVGAAMIVALLLGARAIRRRDFATHGAWMIRAYALGQGAGTQVLTHLPWFLLIGAPGPASRAMLMAAGWLINVVVAELVIAKQVGDRRGGRLSAVGGAS